MKAPLVTMSQVHGTSVKFVNAETESRIRIDEADAMVCTQPGVALGIYTADCLPVLFADTNASVIAAAHAGWRGLAKGILETTVEKMRSYGAKEIKAAIGPAIAFDSFEVDASVVDALNATGDGFVKDSHRSGHYLVNLPALAKCRLQTAGIDQVDILPFDTYALERDFYSHRRNTHRGITDTKRQISAIELL